jgi:hypothetical protein
MAGSFSDYLEKKLLDHLFNKAAYTAPTIYLALSTADPLDDGSGMAEPTIGSLGYARKQTAAGDWATATGTNPTKTLNANDLAFPEATGSWGTIAYFTLMDNSSGGNQLAHGSLAVSKTVVSGDTLHFAAGDLEIDLD